MATKKQKPVKAEKPKYKAVFEKIAERRKALEKSVKRRKAIEDKKQPAKKDTDPWGYKVTKLGKCLLERLRNKKPQGILESLMDCSEEQFNFLADFARSLTKSLGLTENVEKLKSVTKFTYAYKKTAICVVAITERPLVMFPCMDEYTKDLPVKRYADNPLLPFLSAFFQIDTHIYGPAQGLYKVYYAMLRGYLICRYPETRERLLPKELIK